MSRPRRYISVYFESAKQHGKKKGDVTLAFDDDQLYTKVRALSSSEIRAILNIASYSELLEAAKREDRAVSNLIKHRLRIYFNEQENTVG